MNMNMNLFVLLVIFGFHGVVGSLELSSQEHTNLRFRSGNDGVAHEVAVNKSGSFDETLEEVNKRFLLVGISAIPYVGGIASTLLDLFWSKPDRLEQLYNQIMKEVLDEIELNNVKRDVEAINRLMETFRVKVKAYHDIIDPARNSDKGYDKLMDCLNFAEMVRTEIMSKQKSAKPFSLLPQLATTALMEAALLGDRQNNGCMLDSSKCECWFGFRCKPPSHWLKNMESILANYHTNFRDLLKAWSKWRKELITFKHDGLGCKYKVEDSVSSETIRIETGLSSFKYFCDLTNVNLTIERMFNDAIFNMLRVVAPAFHLHRFLPAHSEAKFEKPGTFSEFELGPFHPLTFGSFEPPKISLGNRGMDEPVHTPLRKDYELDGFSFTKNAKGLEQLWFRYSFEHSWFWNENGNGFWGWGSTNKVQRTSQSSYNPIAAEISFENRHNRICSFSFWMTNDPNQDLEKAQHLSTGNMCKAKSKDQSTFKYHLPIGFRIVGANMFEGHGNRMSEGYAQAFVLRVKWTTS